MDYVREHVRPLKSMLDVCLTLEPSFCHLEDLAALKSEADVAHLLGNKFSTTDIDAIKRFSRSILWFTYRRNWPSPIGGFGGPTTDRGWGCMIRCGQMLLAQCLSLIHLGLDWQWSSSKEEEDAEEKTDQDKLMMADDYKRLLRMFQDKKTAQFSIHQIAQMGVSEGKQLGEWLGPNTMGQVLKKLVIYDEWSRLVVHVAMDNVLISSDVRIVATQGLLEQSPPENQGENGNGGAGQAAEASSLPDWKRPLLLIIPLRLGLTAINPCYLDAVVEFFKLPQCVGILGGRPNHAVYFYGSVGERLLYLDPHVCQEFQDIDERKQPPTPQQPQSPPSSGASSHTEEEDGFHHHPTPEFPEEEMLQSLNESGIQQEQQQDYGSNSLLELSSAPSEFMELQAVLPAVVPSMNGNGTMMMNGTHRTGDGCNGGGLDAIPTDDNPICCSPSNESSSVSSFGRCPNDGGGGEDSGHAGGTTISFPTSSSMSKLSSQSGQCRSHSSSCSTSEPEMPVDPVLDRFIDSFADCCLMNGSDNNTGTLTRPQQHQQLRDDQFSSACSVDVLCGDEQRTAELESVCADGGNGKTVEENGAEERGEQVPLLEQDKSQAEEANGHHNGNGNNHEDESNSTSNNNKSNNPPPPSFDDSSFHCPYLLSMDFTSLDPSLALGFLVRDSADYADLVHRLRTSVLPSSSPPLFEILDKRPPGWPEFSLGTSYLQDEPINIKEYDDLLYDSDEQFELLE